MPLLITEDEVKSIMSIPDAIPIVEEGFALAGQGQAECPPRYRMALPIGHLQFGPASIPAKNVVGFKLSAYLGARVEGQGFGRRWNYIFDSNTGELICVIQAYAISMMRTAAASAVAAKYLSAADASRVGLIGAGPHAAAQLEAVCRVRPIREVRVFSRTREKLESFCVNAEEKFGIQVVPADRARDVTEKADIVVTMTNSTEPVLFGEWLGDRPMLVIAAGANHWYKREIDRKVVEDAKLVVVDDRETAKVEGGALLRSATHGMLSWTNVANLAEFVSGSRPMPDTAAGRILFCAHGLALEDVAISAVAYDRARAGGIGREIEF